MKLTTKQLRRIIKEEVTKVFHESPHYIAKPIDPAFIKQGIERFVYDSTIGAGLTGTSYPPAPSKRNPTSLKLQKDALADYIKRTPTSEDMAALEVAWEEGRKKWGPMKLTFDKKNARPGPPRETSTRRTDDDMESLGIAFRSLRGRK